MRKLLLSFLLGLVPQIASAYGVYYDSTTLDVTCWGWQDSKKYLSDYPHLKMISVNDDDPILQNRAENLKFDPVNKKVVLKNQVEISLLRNKTRKEEIIRKVLQLQQQNFEALQLRSEGFDVSIETTTIRQKIDALKQKYRSLP